MKMRQFVLHDVIATADLYSTPYQYGDCKLKSLKRIFLCKSNILSSSQIIHSKRAYRCRRPFSFQVLIQSQLIRYHQENLTWFSDFSENFLLLKTTLRLKETTPFPIKIFSKARLTPFLLKCRIKKKSNLQ